MSMLKTKSTVATEEPQVDTEAVLICPGCHARRYVGSKFLNILAIINAVPGCAALPGCTSCGSMMVMEIYPAAQIVAPVVD